MRVPWFRRGYTPPLSAPPAAADHHHTSITPSQVDKSPSPKFVNAFHFISSMSSGFDLSNLSESKSKAATMFTSKCSATSIMAKIEQAARGLNFKVGTVKDFKLRLQGPDAGCKGRLSVTAEVFEVAPEVAVLEFSKSAGDTLEYATFCEEDVRPALKDIVWAWEGDAYRVDAQD